MLAQSYEPLQGSAWSRASKLKLVALGVVVLCAVATVAAVVSRGPVSDGASDDTPSAALTNPSACPLARGGSDITIQGRKVFMYAPDALSQGPLPLIVMFHGISSSPSDVELKCRFQQYDTGAFLLAYPYGIGSFKAFNGAGCCDKNGPDDVAFAKEIVQYLESNGCSQPYNSFASGFSNGGFMSYKIGCEAGFRPSETEPWFRAIAPHSGLLGSYNKDPYICRSPQNIPVLAFHGDADNTVPISGANPNPFNEAVWQSFNSTMYTWAAHNGCNDQPKMIDRAPSTSCTQFSCPDSTVEYCLAKGLAHNWMGNQRPEEDYDATKAIFNFFLANLKPV